MKAVVALFLVVALAACSTVAGVGKDIQSVSYTHLTLPTNREV